MVLWSDLAACTDEPVDALISPGPFQPDASDQRTGGKREKADLAVPCYSTIAERNLTQSDRTPFRYGSIIMASNQTGTQATASKSQTSQRAYHAETVSSESAIGHGGPSLPAITTPSGGGTLRQMNEAFSVDVVTGTASLSIPVPVTQIARWGAPSMDLQYTSGGGNGVFGIGWALGGLSSITRKTSTGLPTYDDDQDAFMLGSDELVPVFATDSVGNLKRDSEGQYVRNEVPRDSGSYSVRGYRPRIESQYSRVERWASTLDPQDVHWRVIDTGDVTQIFGRDDKSRIASGGRIFSWLPCEAYDVYGGSRLIEYKSEDGLNINIAAAHEQNRTEEVRGVERYLKRIKYGNRKPNRDPTDWTKITPAIQISEDPENGWLFELVFDYGEHDEQNPLPDDDQRHSMNLRKDAFSEYVPGFERRTYRLCKRILMYHHIPQTLEQPKTPSYLRQATITGYKRKGTSPYIAKSLAPMDFEYSHPLDSRALQSLSTQSFDDATMEGMAVASLDEMQWVDLYGDGTTGVLLQREGCWYYKRNLSSITQPSLALSSSGNGQQRAGVGLGPLETLKELPVLKRISLVDLEGDGHNDVAIFDPPLSGYYPWSRASPAPESTWQPFQAFPNIPNIDFKDPNLRFVDLTGDGRTDLLITHDDQLIWYASLGTEGFDTPGLLALATDERQGPRVLFSDPEESIYLADMSGDGLADITRIRNGDICYWPNQGRGSFGSKVAMDKAPVMDTLSGFTHARILLGDVDGSGTTDLFYFTDAGATLYYNEAGNGFSTGIPLDSLIPGFDSLTRITAVDLFGTGGLCLVWESLSAAMDNNPQSWLRYVDLSNGIKPHLLTGYKNNTGLETSISYRSSTSFYLEDQRVGPQWLTYTPYPVQCVSAVAAHDRISQVYTSTRYRYHHGYYDGIEREFRGFGMVEQWDTEEVETLLQLPDDAKANHSSVSYVAPTHTKTWYHLGAFDDIASSRQAFLPEFYQSSSDVEDAFAELHAQVLPTGDEMREAIRALKGMPIHSEVYRDDLKVSRPFPFALKDSGCTVRLIQPMGSNAHAVFQTFGHETISINYEDDLQDGSRTRQLVLEVDVFGNATKTVAVAYGRNKEKGLELEQAERLEQQKDRIIYTEVDLTPAIDENADYRSPQASATRVYEVTGWQPTADVAALASMTAIEYYAVPDAQAANKRLLAHERVYYRRDDLSGLLELEQIQPLALPGQSFSLCLTTSMVAEVYQADGKDLGPDSQMLQDAGYKHLEGDTSWWAPSSVIRYASGADELGQARKTFFRPTILIEPLAQRSASPTKLPIDPSQAVSSVQYDASMLLPQLSTDALGNETTVVNDYRLLRPVRVTDTNENVTAIAYDALGVVVGVAVVGKGGADMDSLDGFDEDLGVEALTRFYQDPHGSVDQLLSSASARYLYDPLAYLSDPKSEMPVFAASILAETFGEQIERKSQIAISYQDGSGRVVQQKSQAENKQWRVSGWQVFNNKGLPVQEYEPFIDDTHKYTANVVVGHSTLTFYDCLSRPIATLYPNHTWSGQVYHTWGGLVYDMNDLIEKDPSKDLPEGFNLHTAISRLDTAAYKPSWLEQRHGGGMGKDEQTAARNAVAHGEKPVKLFFDSFGKVFLTVRDTGSQQLLERAISDVQGNAISTMDAAGRVATVAWFSTKGHCIKSVNLDTGPTWAVFDVLSQSVTSWQGATRRIRTVFDKLKRPVDMLLAEGQAAEVTALHADYGESVDVTSAKTKNLRGKLLSTHDQSGMNTQAEYDVIGACTRIEMQLAADYKTVLDWSAQVALEPHVFVTTYQFDALGRPVSVQQPEGTGITYEYNNSGLPYSTRFKQDSSASIGAINSIEYDAWSREVSRMQANGVTITHQYDSLTHLLVNQTVTKDKATLQSIDYYHDAIGNVVLQVDNVTGDTFFRNSRYSEASKIESSNANNRLTATQVGSQRESYSYDEFGNATFIPGVGRMTWDFLNRMHSAAKQKTNSGTPETASYVYNVAGNRTRKVVERFVAQGATTTKASETLYLDGCEQYFHYDGQGQIQLQCDTSHIDGTGGRTALVERWSGPLQASKGLASTLTRYQYTLCRGSVAFELDDIGNKLSYEEHTPYGATVYESELSKAPKRYRYSGKERDRETGLDYFGQRYYLAWLCRWLNPDPIATEDGLNVYGSASSTSSASSASSVSDTSPGGLAEFSSGDHNFVSDVLDREDFWNSSHISHMFWRESYNGGSRGLVGCTVLTLISRRYLYMSHHWETRGFARASDDQIAEAGMTPADYPDPDYNQTVHNYINTSLNDSYFNNARTDNTQAFIMTPFDHRAGMTDQIEYPGEIGRLQTHIQGLIRGITNLDNGRITVIGYNRSSGGEAAIAAQGTILFQYARSDNGQRNYRLIISGRVVGQDTWQGR
ncbi:hypothetical protein PSPO01_15714 [Paraphaeosphaeria sporulosa]